MVINVLSRKGVRMVAWLLFQLLREIAFSEGKRIKKIQNKRKAKEIEGLTKVDEHVQISFDDDSEDVSEEKDPPPRKSNEHSKKKQKLDSSTPVVKEPLRKNQVHSKPDIHVEEVTVSKPESHVDKQAFISKKDFDAFRDEVHREFKGIRGLMRKKFRKLKKVFAQRKEQVEDIEADNAVNIDKGGLEQSGQHFSPDVVQSLDNISDGAKQQYADKDPELQNMDYVGTEKSPQRLSLRLIKNWRQIFLTSDEKIDEIILSDSQFTIPDEMLPSLNMFQIQSIIIHPSTNRQEDSHHEILDAKTSETDIEDHDQINREITDSEVELNTEEQVRTPPNIQKVTNDEQRDEKLWPDSQNTIPDEFLPSLNVYNQKSIIIHPSANHEVKTPRPKLRIRRPSKFKESPYTEKFGSAAGRSAGVTRIFPHKHLFLYHPIDGIKNRKIVKNFAAWISADLLKATAKRKGKVDHYKREKSKISKMHFGVETVEDKNWFYMMGFADQTWTVLNIDVCFYYLRKKSKYGPHSSYKNEPNKSYNYSTVDCNFMNVIKSLNDVYSMDAQNLKDGGQEHHLMEYINGLRMHAAMPWHTVEDIFIPINIKEKHHWVLAVLSFSERCIFLYD
ncbi:uncharacterized protein LOC124885810 [Capsicum annuum]|uniref:uncharacterized protein LOC124885810 n=1 Tax=Capsicum annuum TaxID=4072 RepID=UPI001FB14C5D|nr:uncharacterized protein LOC124885810 [Capsicum annuum]